MLGYVRDKLMTARLRARYERQVQERLSQLVEGVGPRAVSEEPGGWMPVGSGKTRMTEQSRQDLRQQVRELVRGNPHARNVLRLLEAYVVGDGLRLTVSPKKGASIASEAPEIDQLTDLWQSFLEENRSHFSYREYARRVWRDGECFLRLFADQSWPPTVRFIDAERIGPSIDDPESQGIVTNQNDVEDVEGYILLHRDHGDVMQVIPADVVLHTRYGVDTNEKRGVSFFVSILKPLEKFQEWQETELLARKLQASIVLWRKVQGGAAQANSLAESARSGTSVEVGGGVRQERVRPGTILTTSAGTEMQYLQPNTNYGDAVPLGRMMLLCAAAGAGIPEFMLTADASNGNYASTMVAEGPAVKLFRSEQEFFTQEFGRLWKRVMREAVETGLIEEELLSQVELRWAYPELVSRDRPREREADVRLVEAGILSRAEVQRREKLDPHQVGDEIAREARG